MEIEKLWPYIPEKSREELEEILAYWERMKTEWEKLKQEFRENHNREDFLKLIQWMNKRVNVHREYLDKMSDLERKKFIREYLFDKIIYSWKINKEKE